jgi:uncharacterized protein
MNKIIYANPGCMITVSGKLFNLFEPDVSLITLEDIAHGLAHQCRWNGATKEYYSVAEHSYRGSWKCEGMTAKRAFILHDAEEALWGDIISPIKKLYPEIKQKMDELRMMICEKYGVEPCPTETDRVDNAMLELEYENLIQKKSWNTDSPHLAKRKFLHFLKIYGIEEIIQ